MPEATKAYRTWSERLDSGRLTKSEIQQFAAVISRDFHGYSRRGRPTNLTRGEATKLYRRIMVNPVILTNEHDNQGLNWLQRRGRKALDMPADVHADIVEHFGRFTWNGDIVTTGPYDNGTLPVWTLHLNDGRCLQYFNGAWQSQPGATAWWWITS